MKIKTIAFLMLLSLIGMATLHAQNVTITDDSTHNAHGSSMLDVYSISKGFLMPRLSTSQRTAISSPATGLIVFDTDSSNFFFYNGSAWVNMLTLADISDTIWKEDVANNYVRLNNSINRVGVGVNNPDGKMEVWGDSIHNASDTIPLFAVKDKDGNDVFVVYPRGVMVYVDTITDTSGYKDNVTTSVTGFRVGKKTGAGSKGFDDEYFTISPAGNVDTLGSQARILWYPLKEAFLSGRVIVESPDSVGYNSWASGYLSKSIGDYSQSLGYRPKAVGNYSTAIGNYALALGDNSFALGDSTIAGGGGGNKAASNNCYAFGKGSEATGDGSYAFGKNALSTGTGSFALGDSASAQNEESFAFGRGALAEGYRSFAFGSAGIDSLGQATGVARAIGDYSFAIGQGSIAEGFGSVALGLADTARGNYSISTGHKCLASGYFSTAMGRENIASGHVATTFGGYNKATNYYSTAMGYYTEASGSYSTSMGRETYATGNVSTAIGFHINAPSFVETVIGTYNTSYNVQNPSGWNSGDRIFVVANGTADNLRSNALTVLKNGNIGIGTSQPVVKLDVSGTSTIGIRYLRTNSKDARITIGDTTQSWSLSSGCITDGDFSLIEEGSSADRIYVKRTTGYTGLSTNNPTQRLDVNGNARIRSIGSGAYSAPVNQMADGTLTTASSDRRLKENISPIENSLQKVIRLQGVSFTWKSNPEMGNRIGFIAQDVNEVLPELVFSNPADGYLGINYAEMTAVLVEAVKEQNSMIVSLKDRVEQQQQQIENLKSENEELKMLHAQMKELNEKYDALIQQSSASAKK